MVVLHACQGMTVAGVGGRHTPSIGIKHIHELDENPNLSCQLAETLSPPTLFYK
jgi:hypothetical protein